jgi:molecular chaperone HscA
VTFSVDADGLLHVEAAEQTTGSSASVTVKPSYGLSDDEIGDMLKASIEHAGQDRDARRLVEEQVEAQRVVEALTAALAADGDTLLSAEERAGIDRALTQLRDLVETTQDADAIKRAVTELESDCGFYVERRMNQGIRKAMAGHRVDEFAGEPGRGVEED